VPRYIIYLSKYMSGIVEFCYKLDKTESTMDLRRDMENKYD
jgi:hypothetical protein